MNILSQIRIRCNLSISDNSNAPRPNLRRRLHRQNRRFCARLRSDDPLCPTARCGGARHLRAGAHARRVAPHRRHDGVRVGHHEAVERGRRARQLRTFHARQNRKNAPDINKKE